MLSNNTIQSLWIGDTLNDIEQLTIRSFLAHGHDFHLYVYNKDIKGCPEGAVLKDANEILPASAVYKDVAGKLTSFANWFRYHLLFKRGGWWVDMDVVCLKKFDFLQDYCFTTEVTFDASSNPVIIANNAIMKSPPKAPYLSDMLAYMEEVHLPSADWGRFGSIFLDRCLKLYDSSEYIHPPHVFCKINWHEIDKFFEDNPTITFENSYAIHLWNNMWARKGYMKNLSYGENSIIEKLKRKYLGRVVK